MVSRVYVEKKPGFDGEAKQLKEELRSLLGVGALENLRMVNRYDVEGISDELFAQCVPTVFSEPQSDIATLEMPEAWSTFPASSTSAPILQANASS